MPGRAAKGGAPPLRCETDLFTFSPLADADPPAIEALLDAAFGADRHRRTAYRLRKGVRPVAGLSWAALAPGGSLAGVVQSWPVRLDAPGEATPMVLVGPVAVAPALQRAGLGQALMRRMLAGWDGGLPLVLIGDPEYYGRFGFSAEATGGWQLPGPVERRRLLARGNGRPLPAHGMLGPRG